MLEDAAPEELPEEEEFLDFPETWEPPLERYEEVGLSQAFWQTLWFWLRRRPKMFEDFRPDGLARPILYMVTIQALTTLVSMIALYCLMLFMTPDAGAGSLSWSDLLLNAVMPVAMQLGMGVGVVVVMAFLFSAGFHLLLRTGGALRYRWETTFRAVAYTMGTAGIFNLIPGIGWVFAFAYQTWTFMVALRDIQQVPLKRTVSAVLVTYLVVFLPLGSLVFLPFLLFSRL